MSGSLPNREQSPDHQRRSLTTRPTHGKLNSSASSVVFYSAGTPRCTVLYVQSLGCRRHHVHCVTRHQEEYFEPPHIARLHCLDASTAATLESFSTISWNRHFYSGLPSQATGHWTHSCNDNNKGLGFASCLIDTIINRVLPCVHSVP